MDSIASVLALLFKADYECKEWTNGLLTVGTGIYAAFGKDWVVAIALLLQSPSPAGYNWQGVVLYMLNIRLKDNVEPCGY